LAESMGPAASVVFRASMTAESSLVLIQLTKPWIPKVCLEA